MPKSKRRKRSSLLKFKRPPLPVPMSRQLLGLSHYQRSALRRAGDSRNAAGTFLPREARGGATAKTALLSATGGKDACCGASAIALDLKSRLDAGWSGDQIMKSRSPSWVWVAMALLALTVIGYVATPSMRSTTGMLAASSSAR